MMIFDVIIPTRWDLNVLQNIVESIGKQQLLPNKIHILVDKVLQKDEYNFMQYKFLKILGEDNVEKLNIISNINSDFIPLKWVAYVRNYWIKISNSEYLYLLDDDNVFDKKFFQNTLNIRKELFSLLWKDVILSPTIIYRKTNTIQSRGMINFNFFASKVVLNHKLDWAYSYVKMIWWNSLFAPKSVFEKILFDEKFEFVYEDLDFSYRATSFGIPIIVSHILNINHMERNKTRIEKSFIWDYNSIYQKSRNRIYFTKKNATSVQKRLFFLVWLHMQNLWFVFLILLYWKSKLKLFKWLILWTLDWFK